MADSTYPATGGFVDNTSAATFIPEIWSDEIIAAYQKNLVLANLVKKMSMAGKKGDNFPPKHQYVAVLLNQHISKTWPNDISLY